MADTPRMPSLYRTRQALFTPSLPKNPTCPYPDTVCALLSKPMLKGQSSEATQLYRSKKTTEANSESVGMVYSPAKESAAALVGVISAWGRDSKDLQ
jgi:hypothetical protein